MSGEEGPEDPEAAPAAGVPLGFLAVGFGAALLVLAILYERRVKGFLPQLREWR